MIRKIQNIDINYINYGNEQGQTIVLLHGWGQNIAMMKPLGDALQKEFNIVIIDLPGFGESEEPKTVWTLDDYALAIKELLNNLKITNPILIGHSFGGKISLLYASKYECQKLVLLASPFKQEIKKLSLKTKILKTAKKIPGTEKLADIAKKHVGSTDYKSASKTMREILVEHVNYDLTEAAKKIKAPTIIIWGTKDEAVDYSNAYELEKLIDNAGVVVYENCTHYAYLENLKQTINVLNSFLRE